MASPEITSAPRESLQSVAALANQAADLADEIEKARRLPDELVDRLKRAGAFRALIPSRFGGLQTEFVEYMEVIHQLARADASTAWCVNQAAVIGLTSLWLPPGSTRTIWAEPDASVANGPPFDCLFEDAKQGYVLNGHWGFSSGCQHATWMMAMARYTGGGYRFAYFRPTDVQFIDNWHVAGLKGTGSFEFTIKDLSVSAAWLGNLAEPAEFDYVLAQIPNTLLFATSFACVALGVRPIIQDDVVAIAQGKVPRFSATTVRDDPDVQRFIGRATATWRAAYAYLFDTVAKVVASVSERGEITMDERGELRMAGTYVIQECASVVDAAYKVSGSTGIYQNHTLQRRFQDMHVITQHVQGREAYFAALGRFRMTGKYELGPMM